jgi:NAD(P)-dependent dehydrogenase (short-subunit alcohol dehydrogenase family)
VLIATGRLGRDALAGNVVLVTGAGGGIGFEACRSLLWLGASVVIAEVNASAGQDAEKRLTGEWAADRVAFVPTDVGDELSVQRLVDAVEGRFGKVDVVLNNATFAPFGASVAETSIDVWDRSYAVNLRGPALLARACLPGMIARKHGVFVCVSSTGGPYIAPYETLKAAQLALANSLDAELDGTGVIAFTIGPGLVPTQTALTAIEKLAPRLGMTVEGFWATNRGAVLSVEAAGAGFAASIALAERYPGQEISSSQALIDAGIELAPEQQETAAAPPVIGDLSAAIEACTQVRKTLAEQSAGWQQRSFFERQWMLRDFKQRVGMPVERCLETLERVQLRLAEGDIAGLSAERAPLEKLEGFYDHLGELARGYVKDAKQREEQLQIVAVWKEEVERLVQQTLAPA